MAERGWGSQRPQMVAIAELGQLLVAGNVFRTQHRIEAQGDRNRGPWEPWSEFSPWLLYQYSIETSPYTGEETPVIKLAVESNLGLPDRGLLFGVERKLDH